MVGVLLGKKEKRSKMIEIWRKIKSTIIKIYGRRRTVENITGHLSLILMFLPKFNSAELSVFTSGFSKDNLLGFFQFGEIYRGIKTSTDDDDDADAEVVVKIWKGDQATHLSRLKNEIAFLTHPAAQHRYLPKILGYCWEKDMLGVVYEINPLGTLEKLIDHDCLGWVDRVKIAQQVADLIKYLHETLFLVRNLCASHIILDQDKNAILYEYDIGGMMNCEGAADQESYTCHGYIDPLAVSSGVWRKEADVYSYGYLLLALLGGLNLKDGEEKMTCEVNGLTWHRYKKMFKSKRHKYVCALVDRRLMGQPYFNFYDAQKLTKLAIQCLDTHDFDRPTMEDAVECLKCLFWLSFHVKGLLPVAGYSLEQFSFDDLVVITNDFSDSNFLGKTEFGELYKGKIQEGLKGKKAQDVIVKIWGEALGTYHTSTKHNMCRLKDEISFLRHPQARRQQELPKLMGYCSDNENLGVVYDLKSVATLHSFLTRDSFQWADRMKILHQCACLLQFMHRHDPPYTVGNMSSHNILLDQDMNMVLVDFGRMTGGVVGAKKVLKYLKYGSIDGDSCAQGIWNWRTDVFTFGILVLELMCKKPIWGGEHTCHSMYVKLVDKGGCGSRREDIIPDVIVEDSLKTHPFYSECDAVEITALAQPTLGGIYRRPNINEVVRRIESLKFFSPY